ncbi:MAG: alpha/beta fold hydrolase [Bdellovibrionales bacterium]|nr:alpha/beta fold hydrolase [Bdellovibrionales bacterium]
MKIHGSLVNKQVNPPFKIGAISWLLILLIAIVVGAFYLNQSRLIYFPKRYPADLPAKEYLFGDKVNYDTSVGRQVGFYIPPLDASSEVRFPIWMLFAGNASVALDWIGTLRELPSESQAFFLFDMPGYGFSQGAPSPDTILEASVLAFSALASHLGIPENQLRERVKVLGFSLGAANGLAFAEKMSISEVVLLAPFTDMKDMAIRRVGWPLCHLLSHRFDNRSALTNLMKKNSSSVIFIIHGGNDDVIPVEMGRSLAEINPSRVEFKIVSGAGHNDLIGLSKDLIGDVMLRAIDGELK